MVTRVGLLLVGLAVLSGAAVAHGRGGTPWPLLATVLALGWLSAATRISVLSALPVVLVIAMSAFAIALQLTGLMPWSFETEALAMTVASGLAALALVDARHLRPLQWSRPTQLVVAAAAIPTACGVGLLMWGTTIGRSRLAWAMNGDMVFNTLSARYMLGDGGLDQSLHTNPAPASAGLLAIVISPGRAGTAAEDLLRHDVTRVATLWAMLTLLLAVLIGLTVASASTGLRTRSALGLTAAASVFPLLPRVSGTLFRFGFFNATLALILLVASWAIWIQLAKRPASSTALLALATLAMLACWAPLALVIAALTGWRLVQWLWTRPSLSQWTVAAVLASLLTVPVYAVTVTMPDLTREREAFGGRGDVLVYFPQFFLLLVGCTILALYTSAKGRRDVTIGYAVVLGSGVIVLSYLMAQSAGVWGYYPAKFAWMLIVFAIVICFTCATQWGLATSGREYVAPAIGMAATVSGLFFVSPIPASPGETIGYGEREGARWVDTLFAVAEPGQRRLVAQFTGDFHADSALNHWLLQLNAAQGTDPIRVYAYTLDPTNLEQVCLVATEWGPGTQVVTSEAGFASAMAELCPASGAVVLVTTPGSTVLRDASRW